MLATHTYCIVPTGQRSDRVAKESLSSSIEIGKKHLWLPEYAQRCGYAAPVPMRNYYSIERLASWLTGEKHAFNR
jgi:hypothetical protein